MHRTEVAHEAIPYLLLDDIGGADAGAHGELQGFASEVAESIIPTHATMHPTEIKEVENFGS